MFGNICLNIMRMFDNPIILEADTYSLFFSTRVDALETLANCGHSEIPIAKINTYITISSCIDCVMIDLAIPYTSKAIRMLGIVNWTSVSRITTISYIPPI